MGFFSNPAKSLGDALNPDKFLEPIQQAVDPKKILGKFLSGNGGGGWNPLGDIGNLVKDTAGNVGNLVKDTAGNVGKTATAILSDPKKLALVALSVAAPGAGTAIGEAIGLSGTAAAIAGSTVINTVANGGNVNDALKAAVIGAGVNNIMSGTSSAVTQATGSNAAGAAATGAVSSAIQGKDPLAGAISAGINSGINTLANSAATAINTPTPNKDDLNISPLSSVEEPSDIKPTTDYSVKADYSLGSTSTPKLGVDPETGTGLTASPMTNGAADVGYTPVDYGLVGANAGLGLQMPNSPAIKAMGGGQGLTTNVTNPVTGETGVVGGLGYTPTGAAPVLGNPSSFINNPSVTGQPVMATDPEYYNVNLPKVSVSLNQPTGATKSPLTSTSSGNISPKSTYQDSPLQSIESYLATNGATTPFELAQLKQLFPELTPDMAKILMERVGVTPSMLANPNFLSPETPASVNSDQDPNLSAVELANFGQPDEYAQYAAKGGSMKLPKGHHPEFITGQTGHYAQGRGTGQSDDIPAVLHDGDYVVDADTVAAFGDGSSKAGAGALEHFRRSIPEHHSGGGQPIPAKIADGEYVLPAGFVTSLGRGSNKQGAKMLDAMREQIRAHKRSAPDTKIPPKAKSPLQYMNEAMKG